MWLATFDRSMTSYQDTRVHVCLYLIAPTGHGLRALDLVTMKKLDNKVNIIPIIAKSDTITKEELFQCKAKIMDDIKTNNIQVYQLPVDDEDTADINQRMNADLPFAVVASSEFTVVKGRAQRCRIYPWGTVFVTTQLFLLEFQFFQFLKTSKTFNSINHCCSSTNNSFMKVNVVIAHLR